MHSRALLPTLLFSILLLSGCISQGEPQESMVVPYFEDEKFSAPTGELERYVSPQPDEYGYSSQRYAVRGISCPAGAPPEIVSFSWNNPASEDVYLAGSAGGPVGHYRASHDASFNISARVDYVCEGRPQIANALAQRKEFMLYFAEEGILYAQEARITCPGDFLLSEVSDPAPIEKGIPVGVDSGEGWVVRSYSLVAAEPYDYALYGCGKYSEHWLHTYLRESEGGASCTVGDCRGSWHTFECPEGNEEGVRKEVYAGKGCASVSQQKDFRPPSEWYGLLDLPEFASVPG
jgi:hypothetical protein